MSAAEEEEEEEDGEVLPGEGSSLPDSVDASGSSPGQAVDTVTIRTQYLLMNSSKARPLLI